jgi:hypothetical protein
MQDVASSDPLSDCCTARPKTAPDISPYHAIRKSDSDAQIEGDFGRSIAEVSGPDSSLLGSERPGRFVSPLP